MAAILPAQPASAQGLFDFFFGSARRGPPPSASAYADPSGQTSGGSGTYCVRLCDGRYFPLPRSSGASAAQLCSSFCPAATTKVFHGGTIDYASASDGTRYASLQTAFAYRDKTVQGCSCNGRDSYGLSTLSSESDPTLRSGDIVATGAGFMSYREGDGRQAAFTPLDADTRRRLADTKIVPADATPAPAQSLRHDGMTGHNLDAPRGRRAQLDR